MKTIAYKAFNEDFTCRDFQYEVGKTYKHDGEVEVCSAGFHACKNPMDVWSYYDLTDSRYALVEMTEPVEEHEGDSKIASAEITIKAELKLPEFINKAVEYVIDLCKTDSSEKIIGSSGDYAQIGSSGNYAQIGSSGDYAQIGSSGNYAQIGSSGNYAQIGSSGYSARIGSSGDYARIGSSGDYAQIGSSGNYAQIGSSGYSARIGSSGDYARINSEGEEAVIACAGVNPRFKAKNGAAVAIPYEDENQMRFATCVVGENGIKPDTWYEVKNGEFVEIES